ncbi:MAG: hypothetical protein JW706_08980 [Opitutales bacterium]|nr:hypothetical protein [Opitutales bacterium]
MKCLADGLVHKNRIASGFTILEVVIAAGMSLAAGLTLVYMAGTLGHWAKERSDTRKAFAIVAAVDCELRALMAGGRAESMVESLENGRVWAWVGDRDTGRVDVLSGGQVPPNEQYYYVELREYAESDPVGSDHLAWAIDVRIFWPYRTPSPNGGWMEHPESVRRELHERLVVRR